MITFSSGMELNAPIIWDSGCPWMVSLKFVIAIKKTFCKSNSYTDMKYTENVADTGIQIAIKININFTGLATGRRFMCSILKGKHWVCEIEIFVKYYFNHETFVLHMFSHPDENLFFINRTVNIPRHKEFFFFFFFLGGGAFSMLNDSRCV